MNSYTPDRWVIVEIKSKNLTLRRVLGGWYGGFAIGDYWRMSSGITEVNDKGDYYEIANHSGSIYTCYKNAEGMSTYMSQIYKGYQKQTDDNISIELVKIT